MPRLVDQAKNAGMNSDASVLAKMKRLSELKKHPELETIFAINPDTLDAVVESMSLNGYDRAQPIVLGRFDDDEFIVDGYTRFKAASLAKIDEVPVDAKDFENLQAAIHYCFRRQAERRNLSQAEIYNAAVRLNMPAQKIAKELGVGVSNITRAKKIEREADPDDVEAIKNNKKTINQVYNSIKTSKPKNNALPKNHFSDDSDENNADYNDYQPESDDPSNTDDLNVPPDDDSDSADILDGAIVETSITANDVYNVENSCSGIEETVRQIWVLLTDNGEHTAAALLKNEFPDYFKKDAPLS
jgi:Trp operon repressor